MRPEGGEGGQRGEGESLPNLVLAQKVLNINLICPGVKFGEDQPRAAAARRMEEEAGPGAGAGDLQLR